MFLEVGDAAESASTVKLVEPLPKVRAELVSVLSESFGRRGDVCGPGWLTRREGVRSVRVADEEDGEETEAATAVMAEDEVEEGDEGDSS